MVTSTQGTDEGQQKHGRVSKTQSDIRRDSDQNDVDTATPESKEAIATEGKDDEKTKLEKIESGPPWSSFGRWEKKFIVMIASLGAFFSPLTTNIYFPALNQISTDLGVTISQVNLSITTYMVRSIAED